MTDSLIVAIICNDIYFASVRTELVANICFTEEEYNIRTKEENCTSFEELIDVILMFVNESGGGLEDAVDMANDAFGRLWNKIYLPVIRAYYDIGKCIFYNIFRASPNIKTVRIIR